MIDQILPYYVGMILATAVVTLAYLHATVDKPKRRRMVRRFTVRRISK